MDFFETGTVRWFNSAQGKRFGFITPEKGPDIWFHFGDGRPIRINKTRRTFEFSPEPTFRDQDNRLHQLRDPKAGDEVVFVLAGGSKGLKASPWCFKSIYDQVLKKIDELPEPATYKVLETRNDIGELPGEPTILWIGQDLEDLSKQYPRPTGNSVSPDPLIPYWGDSDGIFEVHHWFEKKTDQGFVPCEDPRP